MRDDLITTAVHFLKNQKVQSSPLDQRINFLEKKGLQQDEIREALKRSGIENEITVNTNHTLQMHSSKVNMWERSRQIISTIVVISGTIYFANTIYKKYVAPWLGLSKASPTLEEVLSLVAASNERTMLEVNQMVAVVTEMQRQITENHKTITDHIQQTTIENNNMLSLQNEIKSVKALLLRKDQFPPPPVLNPVIPSWQLEKKSPTPTVNDAHTNLAEDNHNDHNAASDGSAENNTDNNEIA